MLRPANDSRLSPSDLRGAYIDWCAEMGFDPLQINLIAPALGKLFRKAGIGFEAGRAVGVAVRVQRL